MNALQSPGENSYSPPLQMELTLHGQRLQVASLGNGRLSVRDARPIPAGQGTVCVLIDGEPTVFSVDLFNGIDPQRSDQQFQMLGALQEAAV
jgi:hypothetical protein